jgi:hypothetical protein
MPRSRDRREKSEEGCRENWARQNRKNEPVNCATSSLALADLYRTPNFRIGVRAVVQQRTLSFRRSVSVFGGRSQPVEATLYLRGKRWSAEWNEDFIEVLLRGVAEGDRESFIVDLFSGGSAWWDSSRGAASLQVGIDACGTRGDFPEVLRSINRPGRSQSYLAAQPAGSLLHLAFGCLQNFGEPESTRRPVYWRPGGAAWRMGNLSCAKAQ